MTDREIYNKQPFFLEPRRHSDREVHGEITAKAFRREGTKAQRRKEPLSRFKVDFTVLFVENFTVVYS